MNADFSGFDFWEREKGISECPGRGCRALLSAAKKARPGSRITLRD
jgi:hypothetical protein